MFDWFDTQDETPDEEISPAVAAMLAALDVPVELLSFDYGEYVQ